jgi:nitrogen fixation/metabolism regulation signal transduction histidine kinase
MGSDGIAEPEAASADRRAIDAVATPPRRRPTGAFARRLHLRHAHLFASLALLAYLVVDTQLRAVTLVVASLTALQAGLVVHWIGRTNRELARLVAAIRYDDFQQSSTLGPLGASFPELDHALGAALTRFRDARMVDEARRRTLEALVEQVPVALLAIRADDTVELLNNAARRLLNLSSRTTLAALGAYGPAFQRDVAQSEAGDRTLTRTELDGLERHLVLTTTQITANGESQRLLSLQDIQRELDTTELSAWQDMVRVISHEIMNSLTPIASLARTADEIVKDVDARHPGIDHELMVDLGDAVQTLARRSDGLLRFVRSYRQLTQMPPPLLRPLALGPTLHRLARLFEAEWADRGVALHVRQPIDGLTVLADESLLDQALVNLLRNAADAAASADAPQVWLGAGVSERGRPVIEISDNGPGFADDIKDKIFLPFFTTKADGSGIGLALARQVMLIHQGAITAGSRPEGGALFRLTF